MTDPHSHAELYEIGRAAALLKDTEGRLNDRSFDAGNNWDILTGIPAALAEEAEHVAVQLVRKLFLRQATGDDLDALVEDRWALTRLPASKATVTLTLSRATSAAGNVSIPIGHVFSTADGIRFVATEARVLSGLSQTVIVEAETAGEDGNVAAATITQSVDTIADASVTITNALLAAGGGPEETDDQLVDRVRDYVANLRRGTIPAVLFGASQISGVATVSLDESVSPMVLYVADVTGSGNAALVARVVEEIKEWRAAGAAMSVVAATLVNQAVTVALTFAAGVDTALLAESVREAIQDYGLSLAIGDTLRRNGIIAAALSVEGVLDATVSVPSGDVVPTAAQLLRTPKTSVTVS